MNDDDLVIEIAHPPFGHERAFASLYVAKVCILRGMLVTVVLRGEGVFTGLRGQQAPMDNINLPSTEAQLEEILGLDARVVAEREALEHGGIGEGELVNGIETVSTKEIHDIIMNTTSKAISF